MSPAAIERAGGATYDVRLWQWLALVALMVAALSVRTLRTDATSLNFDELMSLHLSAGHNFAVDHLPREIVLTGLPDLVGIDGARPIWTLPFSLSGDVHPPLYYVALRVWRELFGDSTLALRSLSAVFGAAGVAAVAFAGRELAGTACGLAAATAVTFASAGVYFGQEVRMYAMAACLSAVAIGATARIARLGVSSCRGALLGASVLALMLTLYLALSVCLAIGAYVIVGLRGRDRRGALLWLAASAAVFAMLWLPSMLRQDWHSEKADWLNSPAGTPGHVAMTFERLAPAPLDQFGILRRSDLPSGYVYSLLLIALPAAAVGLRRPGVALPYMVMLATFGLPVLRDCLRTTNMLAYDRYLVLALPAQALVITTASATLLRGWPRWLPPLALAAFALISLPRSFERGRYDFRGNARFAEREAAKDNRRLIVMTDGVTGYNGGLLLAVQRYWTRPPGEVVLVDSRARADVLPRAVTGDKVVLLAGHEAQPDRFPLGFARSGPLTFDGGVGYVVVLDRIADDVLTPATTPP